MNAGVPAVGEQSGIDDLLAAGILVVDGRELTGRDLLAAGVVSGRWQQLERELSDGLGLVAAQPPAMPRSQRPSAASAWSAGC